MSHFDLFHCLTAISSSMLSACAEIQKFAHPGSHQGLQPDAFGYIASSLVFATFCMRSMVPLRVIGICSNFAFLIYAASLGLMPVAVLHSVLLPVNLWRLWEALQEKRAMPRLVAWRAVFGQPGN